ncbi:cellulase family glycosylhydrolase [Streptomonospora sp. PA3]|uniref:cellulase family glycosylhydrolase n=1 Tax=Streptomonospora sp. PA3 TaxID=2607326 RepID=UPI0012DDDDB6|nr:cellulase family glycosylhydrolase [Streptomonospora sp. PA3]MUL41190.1 cellulase family glycosylhydrolase [Streptomonospora sp. PA3]
MRTRLALAASAVFTLVLSLLAIQPASAETGFHIQNGRLVDASGKAFVMRGVNHPHSWFTGETESFGEIASLGANAVRVVLSNGVRWTRNDAADVAGVISECKEHRLICVLEVHDTTGYGEESAASSLDQAVDYWIDIQSALEGQEAYTILNIGNEPYGNQGYESWAADTSAAIERLRAAGYEHTLMVDAPNWGQDWTNTMRDNAAQVFESDPDRNVLFDIHMYGVYEQASRIQDYLGYYVDNGLPIVVGEFGHDHSDGNPDEDAIMATAEQLGVGYLGWSYSGNSGGVDYLDLTNDFDPSSLTSWGERLFNGPDGIVATAETAGVYDGGTEPDPDPTEPPDPDPTEPPTTGDGCTADYTVQNEWGSGFVAQVTVTAQEGVDGWEVTWTYADGQSVSSAWNAEVSSSGSQVTATNVAYNGTLSAGQSTSFGLQGTYSGTNPVPELTCSAS